MSRTKETKVDYTKVCKLHRPVLASRHYIVASVPYEAVEKEAQGRGLTVDEFLKQYRLVWEFNKTDGIKRITFQPALNTPKSENRATA